MTMAIELRTFNDVGAILAWSGRRLARPTGRRSSTTNWWRAESFWSPRKQAGFADLLARRRSRASGKLRTW
jgi:hypothetical protein